MGELYPLIPPYREDYLEVSDLDTIHFEESGNPQGKPILLLHGRPGGASPPFSRQYFHPEK
jgi:proline iminopeptidase